METRIDSQTGEATQYRTASRSVAEQYNQDRSARKEESGQNIIEKNTNMLSAAVADGGHCFGLRQQQCSHQLTACVGHSRGFCLLLDCMTIVGRRKIYEGPG